MKHFTREHWLKYVKNEVNDDDRKSCEDHLYSCDQCLDLYLQAVAEHAAKLPDLSGAADFTDRVMAEVEKIQAAEISKESGKVRPFYQTALFHYMLAAAMTMLFMFTGVFHAIAQYAGMVQDPVMRKEIEKPSITEELMDKTFAWIDSFEGNNKEAGK